MLVGWNKMNRWKKQLDFIGPVNERHRKSINCYQSICIVVGMPLKHLIKIMDNRLWKHQTNLLCQLRWWKKFLPIKQPHLQWRHWRLMRNDSTCIESVVSKHESTFVERRVMNPKDSIAEIFEVGNSKGDASDKAMNVMRRSVCSRLQKSSFELHYGRKPRTQDGEEWRKCADGVFKPAVTELGNSAKLDTRQLYSFIGVGSKINQLSIRMPWNYTTIVCKEKSVSCFGKNKKKSKFDISCKNRHCKNRPHDTNEPQKSFAWKNTSQAY